MAGLYGHRWTSAYGEDPRGIGGREWAATLAGFTRDQVDAGLDACRASSEDWPPSAPTFKARCLGIPSFARFKADVTQRNDGFTRLAWRHIDGFAFGRADQREAERILRVAYDYTVERRMFGDEYPDKPAAIAHERRKPKPATEDQRAKHIERIGRILGCTPQSTDDGGLE